MKTNLNSRCTAVLTAFGAKVWNLQFDTLQPAQYRPAPKQAGDTITTQLWCVMEVFGPHIHMGMMEVPFEGNNLEIEPC